MFSGRQAQEEIAVETAAVGRTAAGTAGRSQPGRFRAGVLSTEPREIVSKNNAIQRASEQSKRLVGIYFSIFLIRAFRTGITVFFPYYY